MTRLVVGLGNPGPEYAWTPHNVGFQVVEALAAESKLIFGPSTQLGPHRPPASCSVARDEGRDAWLVKPLAYMNRSGEVVAPLSRALGVAAQDLFVVYDDIDLPLGALRIRPHGGHGGHNGMRSTISELGTDRFPRLRVGVGRPRTDAARHVLSAFAEGDLEVARIAAAHAAQALDAWLLDGELERLMTRFHSRWTLLGFDSPP